jgi:hypothetical protein
MAAEKSPDRPIFPPNAAPTELWIFLLVGVFYKHFAPLELWMVVCAVRTKPGASDAACL